MCSSVVVVTNRSSCGGSSVSNGGGGSLGSVSGVGSPITTSTPTATSIYPCYGGFFAPKEAQK